MSTLADRYRHERPLGQPQRGQLLGDGVIAEPQLRAGDPAAHARSPLDCPRFASRSVEVGIRQKRSAESSVGHRQPAAELHVGDQRAVDADVEPERTVLPNGEVRHDLRVTPDSSACLQSESLVDRHVVDEGAGGAERSQPARTRAVRIDHDAGRELVVRAEVTVEVAGQHQVDDGATGPVLAHLKSAVIDELLRRIGIDGEHRGVQRRPCGP